MEAGTSGRLAVGEAAECVPTFGVAGRRVVGVIAGGPRALARPVEGAEDDAAAGRRESRRLRLSRRDSVVGISASGTTAFVVVGGTRNSELMRRLRERLSPAPFEPSDAAGVGAREREAVAFAILAAAHLQGVPAGLPAVTGASRSCILGKLSP